MKKFDLNRPGMWDKFKDGDKESPSGCVVSFVLIVAGVSILYGLYSLAVCLL